MIARLLVVLASLLAAPSAAWAHKLLITARVEPPASVFVEVRYDSNDPGEPGTIVTLTDAAGSAVARTTTDDQGTCRLPRPSPGAYTLTADDGAGHREAIAFVVPEESTGLVVGSAERARGPAIAAGLAIIALGTGLAWWLLRRRRA